MHKQHPYGHSPQKIQDFTERLHEAGFDGRVGRLVGSPVRPILFLPGVELVSLEEAQGRMDTPPSGQTAPDAS